MSAREAKRRTLQRLLTLQQAAQHTNIPAKTLWMLTTRGELPSVRLPGAERRIWIREDDLIELIERATVIAP